MDKTTEYYNENKSYPYGTVVKCANCGWHKIPGTKGHASEKCPECGGKWIATLGFLYTPPPMKLKPAHEFTKDPSECPPVIAGRF